MYFPVIAFPVAWWMMDNWLQGYAYKITITSSTFLIAASLVMVITLCAIGFQTIKVSIVSPAQSLRTD